MMRLSKSVRAMLVGACSMALLAVMVVGVRGTVASSRGAGGAVAGIAAEDCSGDCATCPMASTDQCANCATAAADKSAAHVDSTKCIGCAKCVKVAPEAYEMDADTGTAKIQDGASQEAIERGAKACPVGAVVK